MHFKILWVTLLLASQCFKLRLPDTAYFSRAAHVPFSPFLWQTARNNASTWQHKGWHMTQMSIRNGTKQKKYSSLGNPLRMYCVRQETCAGEPPEADFRSWSPSLPSHKSPAFSGQQTAQWCQGCCDGELPWLHSHTVPPPTHTALTWAARVWHLHKQQGHCLGGVLTATVQLRPAGTSLQGAGCTQVTALCTGGIMTGTYRFQQHAAPPDCTSAFKERADIWATWSLSTWGRIPKYTIIPAKWLQPGGHQDIAWYSYTWMKTTVCWLYKRLRR